jgi:hypothetical protein
MQEAVDRRAMPLDFQVFAQELRAEILRVVISRINACVQTQAKKADAPQRIFLVYAVRNASLVSKCRAHC